MSKMRNGLNVALHPGHFTRLPWAVQTALREFITRPDNVIRMETACDLARPAVEALSEGLVSEFGAEIDRQDVKQSVGHFVRQVMEADGYEIERKRVRITRPGLFSTGITFRRSGQARRRCFDLVRDRASYVSFIGTDEFNSWLDGLVRGRDGVLDPGLLRQIAKEWNVEHVIKWQDVKIDRLQLGVVLRPYVPAWYWKQNTEDFAKMTEVHLGKTANSPEEAEALLGVDRRRQH